MEQSHLTCRSCGQHFETKSDLQDHELNCQGTGVGQSRGQSKAQGQGQNRQKQSGDRTRTAGSGGREESGG